MKEKEGVGRGHTSAIETFSMANQLDQSSTSLSCMYPFLVASVTAGARIIAAWEAIQLKCTGGHQCGDGLACERTSF